MLLAPPPAHSRMRTDVALHMTAEEEPRTFRMIAEQEPWRSCSETFRQCDLLGYSDYNFGRLPRQVCEVLDATFKGDIQARPYLKMNGRVDAVFFEMSLCDRLRLIVAYGETELYLTFAHPASWGGFVYPLESHAHIRVDALPGRLASELATPGHPIVQASVVVPDEVPPRLELPSDDDI